MKVPRKAIVAAIVVLLALTALSLYLQFATPQNTGPWIQSAPYPLDVGGAGVFGQSCVTDGGTVFCIGGQGGGGGPTNQTYSAPLSASGVGAWSPTTPYPISIMFQSCVTNRGYVYCIGGTMDSTGDDVSSSYFAPVGSGALGSWKSTTPFPVSADSQSCVSSSGYVYCAGGENETSGTNSTATTSSSVWYAPLTSSGIGAWSKGPAYPSGVYYPECTTLGGYMYCVGGQDSSGNPVSSSYYSYLTSQGMGAWSASTQYPAPAVAVACTTSSTLIYCIDGLQPGGAALQSVYYAGLTPSGIGGWQSAASYPEGLATTCVSSGGYIYCIGGYNSGTGGPTSDVYYAPLAVNSTSTTSGSG